MGSRIYTRGGDRGTTSLLDGSRVPKDAQRLEAYGTLDELNSCLGAARAIADDPLLDACLHFFQHRIYNCSSTLAAPPGTAPAAPAVTEEDVGWLERAVDRFERDTGPIGFFILPGGCGAAGMLHVARTVCRRAERRLVSLSASEPVDPAIVKFVNRGSDFLFAAARLANHTDGCGDVRWDGEAAPPEL